MSDRSRIVQTADYPLVRMFATNSTQISTTAPSPTGAEPSGDGIREFAPMNAGLFMFTAVGAADTTMRARITAWRRLFKTGSAAYDLWVPHTLLFLTITVGTATGPALHATNVPVTERFADTIVATNAFTTQYEILSPADNTVASVKVDLFGSQKVQVQLDTNSSSTSCNALMSGF